MCTRLSVRCVQTQRGRATTIGPEGAGAMQPPRRIRKLFTGEAPADREGVRTLMEKLAREGDQAGHTDVRLIPQMREAVMERVERTSLRTAAREIGMSPSGLKKFLDGNMP